MAADDREPKAEAKAERGPHTPASSPPAPSSTTAPRSDDRSLSSSSFSVATGHIPFGGGSGGSGPPLLLLRDNRKAAAGVGFGFAGSKDFALHLSQSLSSGGGGGEWDSSDRDNRLRKALQDQNFTINKLNLSEIELHGREKEMATLREALDEAASGRGTGCVVASVVGRAGTGKTRLVQEFLRSMSANDGADRCSGAGLCLYGKADFHHRSEPYASLAAALSDVPRRLAAKGAAYRRTTCQRIRTAVGGEGHLLATLAPELATLLGADERDPGGNGDCGGVDAYTTRSDRLQYVFRQFVGALGSPGDPAVLFLDDAQWCDGPSLSLVTSLLASSDNDTSASPTMHALLLTAAREEADEGENDFLERDDDSSGSGRCRPTSHYLQFLQALELRQGRPVRTIRTGSLDQSAVLSIVSTALRSSEEKTFKLSEIVHQKSHGNALYVIQFLTSLYDEGLLQYNLGLMQWTWEESKVRSRFVTDNVAGLAISKVGRLPLHSRRVLQIAACLGQSFDVEHLRCVVQDPRVRRVLEEGEDENGDRENDAWPVDLSGCLADLVDEAVIDYVPELQCHCFVHDLIQDAAFRLIHEDRSPRLQSEVGRQLLKCRHEGACRSPNQCGQYYFRAVDLSNAGLDYFDADERLKLAQHNLEAGRKAMEQAAFAAALRYMENGQRCLGNRGWSDQPAVALSLSTGAVEASYCCGDFESMEKHMASVLQRDIPVEDKVRVYLTRILSYGAQDQNAKALDTGRHVLLQMGMTRLPRRPGMRHVVLELMKTKLLLRRHTESTLLSLPLLKSEQWRQAMSVVDMMNAIAYCTDMNFFAVMTLRMLRWVVTYGVCRYAPTVFSTYGIILCGLGELRAARMFGNVAMTLSERLNARSSLAKTIIGVYGLNVHCTTNLRFCLKPLLYGHKLGMETGEVEIAMYNLSQNGEAQLVTAASPLKALVPKMRANANLMRDYNQEGVRSFQLLALQFALKLIGPASHPSVLTGAVVDEDEARTNAREIGNKVLASFLENYCLQLAYYFEDYERADRYSRATIDFTKVAGGHFMITRNLFFRGLTALALAGEGINRRRNLSTAADITRQLHTWSESGNINCVHLVQLLQAETASVQNSGPDAIRLYWKAINSASRNGYLNDKALAHERAFLFHLRTDPGDLFWAQSHYNDAVLAYCDWNAYQKARHLVKRYGSRFDPATVSNFSVPTSSDYDEEFESMIS